MIVKDKNETSNLKGNFEEHHELTNKHQRMPKGQSNMNNPEKLATSDKQNED